MFEVGCRRVSFLYVEQVDMGVHPVVNRIQQIRETGIRRAFMKTAMIYWEVL